MNKKVWVAALATILLALVSIAASNQQPTPAVASLAADPLPHRSLATSTADQALQIAVQSTFATKGALDLSYQVGQVETDDAPPARPAGAKFVTVDLNVTDFLDNSEFITDTGRLATAIFQQVFPLDTNYYDVLRCATTLRSPHQYGNTKSDMVMSYTMTRPIYTKINWTGFPNTGNDIHMCAFLRQQESLLATTNPDETYLGCVVLAGNIKRAENAIETADPRYRDIPQYP